MRRSTLRLYAPAPTLAAALTLAVSACAWDPVMPWEDGRSVLGAFDDPVQVQTPEEVARGAEFEVEILTHGDGCTEKGDTKVNVDGLRAVVVPYDIDTGRRVCFDIRKVYRHKATLRFDSPGTATIVFIGRRGDGGEHLTVERTVEVR